jgi:hypothetical protein
MVGFLKTCEIGHAVFHEYRHAANGPDINAIAYPVGTPGYKRSQNSQNCQSI